MTALFWLLFSWLMIQIGEKFQHRRIGHVSIGLSIYYGGIILALTVGLLFGLGWI